MNNLTHIKKLVFPFYPLIYIYISYDYDKATTYSSLIETYYKWVSMAETTKNIVAKTAYETAAYVLYQELTSRSFNTKQFKTL